MGRKQENKSPSVRDENNTHNLKLPGSSFNASLAAVMAAGVACPPVHKSLFKSHFPSQAVGLLLLKALLLLVPSSPLHRLCKQHL